MTHLMPTPDEFSFSDDYKVEKIIFYCREYSFVLLDVQGPSVTNLGKGMMKWFLRPVCVLRASINYLMMIMYLQVMKFLWELNFL